MKLLKIQQDQIRQGLSDLKQLSWELRWRKGEIDREQLSMDMDNARYKIETILVATKLIERI